MISKEVLRAVRRLEIRTRRALDGPLAGLARSTAKGRGLSFAEVRPYAPGDNVRDIDWKVTARFGRPFLKTYVDERQRTAWLLADVSPSMTFGSVGRSKLDVMIDAAALMALVFARMEDRVGLVTFGGPKVSIPPARGRRHALRLVRELMALDSARPTRDFQQAISLIRPWATQRAVVVALSDFRFDGALHGLRSLAHRHEVRALRFVDPWEREIPRLGLAPFRDLESGEERWIDTEDEGFRDAYARRAREDRKRFQQSLAKSRIEYHEIETEISIVRSLALQLANRSSTCARRRRSS